MILTGAQIPMTHSHSLRRVALGLLIAGVTLLSGCVTKRYVTHVTWLDEDTFYVAYSEVDRKAFSTTEDVKIQRCKIQADRTTACNDEAAVAPILNKRD